MADTALQLQGLDGALRMLQDLPAEVVSKRGGPVRAALRKGALVILREESLNLARAINALSGDEAESTGLLLKSLVATRGKPPTSGNGERYLVRVKRKTYQRRGRPVTTLKTAQIKEYGSEKQSAEPWIRPAFNSKAAEAITTTEADLLNSIERIASKLLQQNKTL